MRRLRALAVRCRGGPGLEVGEGVKKMRRPGRRDGQCQGPEAGRRARIAGGQSRLSVRSRRSGEQRGPEIKSPKVLLFLSEAANTCQGWAEE